MRHELFDVGRGHVGDERADLDLRVDSRDGPCRGDGLRRPGSGVGLVEQQLPLEIAQLDEVAVDDRDVAHAGPGQEIHRHRT